MLSYSISPSRWRILQWMFPLFNIDGGNKISLRWNIPFSHAVCSLANSSLLVWQNSELSEDTDFLKADKVSFGKNTSIPFHPPASGVLWRANVLPEHKRTAHQSLFCQTAQSWLWAAAFLWSLSDLVPHLSSPQQCNWPWQVCSRAHKCQVALRMISCSPHSAISKTQLRENACKATPNMLWHTGNLAKHNPWAKGQV